MAQLTATLIEHRGVIVVGKNGAGKSTIANALANREEDIFPVSSSPQSCTKKCSNHEFETKEKSKTYLVNVMDTVGLFDTDGVTNKESLLALKKHLENHFQKGINLIVFVLREGRFSPEEKKSFEYIRNEFDEDISTMSALVLTNCDTKNEKARTELVQEFKKNPLTKPTAEFMKAGIYAVGFPPKADYVDLPSNVKSFYEESVTKDKEVLWELVKKSKEARLPKELCKKSFWIHCTIL